MPSFPSTPVKTSKDKAAYLKENINGASKSEQEDAISGARRELESFSHKFADPQQRYAELEKRIEPVFKNIGDVFLPPEQQAEIRKQLQSCSTIEDPVLFTDAAMAILLPVIKVREEHKKEFEEAQAKAMNELSGFTEINRLLSYGKDGDRIHIHAPFGRTVEGKLKLYREGMRKLAEIVENDPEVKKITATSALVAEHPSLFERAGFEISEVPEWIKEEHFDGQKNIKKASISRDEFLKRFLVKK